MSMNIHKSEMKAWAKENLVGVENIAFPSFSPDLSELDEDGIRWDVQQSIRHGFFSTLCAVETGMTFDEIKRFVSIVADEGRGKILVSLVLLVDSFEKTMALIRHAEKVGCHSVTLGFPTNYYPHDLEAFYESAKTIIEATNLAITIYPSPHFNLGRFHHSGFPPTLVARLAELPNVVGCKVGEPGLVADIHRLCRGQILISNPVERFLPLMWQSCQMQWIGAGCYEYMQSVDKPYVVDYFRMIREGKTKEGMEIFWKLNSIRSFFEQQHGPTAMSGTYNWPMQKYYLWLVGGNGGYTRQPCMKIHKSETEPYKRHLNALGIDVNENEEEFYYGKMNYEKMRKGTLRVKRIEDL